MNVLLVGFARPLLTNFKTRLEAEGLTVRTDDRPNVIPKGTDVIVLIKVTTNHAVRDHVYSIAGDIPVINVGGTWTEARPILVKHGVLSGGPADQIQILTKALVKTPGLTLKNAAELLAPEHRGSVGLILSCARNEVKALPYEARLQYLTEWIRAILVEMRGATPRTLPSTEWLRKQGGPVYGIDPDAELVTRLRTEIYGEEVRHLLSNKDAHALLTQHRGLQTKEKAQPFLVINAHDRAIPHWSRRELEDLIRDAVPAQEAMEANAKVDELRISDAISNLTRMRNMGEVINLKSFGEDFKLTKDELLRVRVEVFGEWARSLDILQKSARLFKTRSRYYELMKNGTLPSIQIRNITGPVRVTSLEAVTRYLENHPEEAAEAVPNALPTTVVVTPQEEADRPAEAHLTAQVAADKSEVLEVMLESVMETLAVHGKEIQGVSDLLLDLATKSAPAPMITPPDERPLEAIKRLEAKLDSFMDEVRGALKALMEKPVMTPTETPTEIPIEVPQKHISGGMTVTVTVAPTL